jgi:flagellar biosynthesis protein FlhF
VKLKRYVAATMRSAMALVREELGDDAVIMSTRNMDEGVEIVAAIDPEAMAEKERAKQAGAGQPHSHYRSSELQAQASTGYQTQVEIARMAQELQAVKSMLENQLSGLAWNQTEQMAPHKVDLLKKLMRLGIGWELAQQLVERVDISSERAWSMILEEIEKTVPVQHEDLIEKGGIIALVGPTGVGKTTTIAKLASRFVMRNSANELALVTTDCYKIGAQAQLKTFADLIGVPVHVAATQKELYALLASLAHKKLILIDTAGMSQRDIKMSQQLTAHRESFDRVKNILVMSAATQLHVMQDIIQSFKKVGLSGCIMTKMDEALQLGNILTVLIENKLPLTYISNGQKVPEDLERVDVRTLIDQAIVLGQQNQYYRSQNAAFKLGMGKEISDA